jgi:hypothetical protein
MEDDAALAALAPVVAAAVVDTPSPDPRSFAGALYLQGLILQRQQQHESAFEAHAQCIERYLENHHPVARECVIRCLDGDVIADAVRHHPPLLARLPAAHHALRLPANFAKLQAIGVEMADASEATREAAVAALREIVLNDDARAAARHERARDVLRRHFESGQPFGLYLGASTGESAGVERNGGLPFIGLANGSDAGGDVDRAMPRLEVTAAWWTAVVETLRPRASRVVPDQ